MEEVQDWTEVSYEEAKITLRKWREDHERRSEETVEIWEHVLSSYSNSLGDELWLVLEQVFIAALDSSRHDLALDCLQTLNIQFPKSSRVTKLQALRLEALGKYDEAEYLYNNLLEADETNMALKKRKAAILLAQGKRLEAIRLLDEYLHTFLNDTEAWTELGELYLAENDHLRAIFCFEEPTNAALFCRLAELRYTLGGQDNLEIARNYYEKASTLNLGPRALYGLILTSNSLIPKASAPKRKEILQSANQAILKLEKVYKESLESNASAKTSLACLQQLKSHFSQQV